MKKLFALLIVLTMIIGLMPVVSAAIPQNNGFGAPIVFDNWSRNSPSSGTYCATSTVEDNTFGTVTRYEGKGVANGTNYTQYKQFINFGLPAGMSAPVAGDKVMVSFYYRINVSGDYVAPTAFQGSSSLNKNATTGINFGDVSIVNEWQYVSYISTIDSTLYGSPAIRQVSRFVTSSNTDKFSVDIADVKAVYMGAVTAEDGATVNEQIISTLSSTAITSITAGGTNVDLTANPTSYTTTDALTADDVSVTTRYGTADKVVIEEAEDGTSMTIKVYAPYIDWRATDATPSATYTINMEEAEEPYVIFTENNGYGTGVILGVGDPEYVGSVGREYNKLETIKGAAAAPFDEYYS